MNRCSATKSSLLIRTAAERTRSAATTRSLLASLALGMAVGVGGCASESADPAVANDDLVSQGSSDLTVLKAEALDPINGNGSPGFVESDCKPVASAPGDQRIDCTAPMEKRFGAPALHDILVPLPQSLFFCRVMRVTTVTKKAAFDNATGAGFYYRGYGGNGRFVPKGNLKSVGEVTLKNGDAAVLHEFVGLANCFLGSASSSMQARYDFKPFVRFVTPSETYDNWDLAKDNYVLTTRNDRFDRSAELLK